MSDLIGLDKQTFLKRYRYTEQDIEKAELDWHLLEQICLRHQELSSELDTTATDVATRLQRVPHVHSLKKRIKHPEHVIDKLIRKRLKDTNFSFSLESYETCITDLIGIRALHLVKGEWHPIHEVVTATWDLHEIPIAYVREGDAEASDGSPFHKAGLDVRKHKFGYRSIHYILKSQPTKSPRLVELQVRTLFEEGWSEIDHRLRYPRQSDNPYLAQFLTIFNRLAGSADEMGTFVTTLCAHLIAQERLMAERDEKIAKIEKDLQIERLNISDRQKADLQELTELLKTSETYPLGLTPLTLSPGLGLAGMPIVGSYVVGNPGLYPRVCDKCGKAYYSSPNLVGCPWCGPLVIGKGSK